MKTDKEIHELFTSDPSELYQLLDLPYPAGGAVVRAEQFKQVEQTSDLIAVPLDEAQPAIIFEFQAQRVDNLHGRGLVAAGLFLQRYASERRCQVHVVYFSRAQDPQVQTPQRPAVPPPCANFAPFVHYLDERMRQLETQEGNHPLVSVFFPLLETDGNKLHDGFLRHYANLKATAELPDDARERWCDVYQLWLMRALKRDNLEEIRAMLLEDLPQVEDTVWGQELIQIHLEKGREEGREQGREEGREQGREEGRLEATIEAIQNNLQLFDQWRQDGLISQEAFEQMTRAAKLRLEALQSPPGTV